MCSAITPIAETRRLRRPIYRRCGVAGWQVRRIVDLSVGDAIRNAVEGSGASGSSFLVNRARRRKGAGGLMGDVQLCIAN